MHFNVWLAQEPTTVEVVSETKNLLHHETFQVVALALAEVAIAWILSSMAKRWCERVTEKSINKGVMTFMGSFVSIAIKAAGVVIALDQLGVSMNVIVGAMSGLGVGIALALKSNMASVASGLQILLTKPFKVGDYIQIGTNYGTVASIELTFTTLITHDNEEVIIPNNNFLSNNLVNFTSRPTLRCVLDFPCNAGEIQYYIDRLALCAAGCSLVLKDPQPICRVGHYGSSAAADLKLIYYCNTDQYWETYDEVTRAVSSLFTQTIPTTAPEYKPDEPEANTQIPPVKAPQQDTQPADSTSAASVPSSSGSVKQEIQQIVNDILPVPLPGLPAQKPIQSTIEHLIRTAASKKNRVRRKEIHHKKDSHSGRSSRTDRQVQKEHPHSAGSDSNQDAATSAEQTGSINGNRIQSVQSPEKTGSVSQKSDSENK